jgi:ribose transport system substrate-binding protein
LMIAACGSSDSSSGTSKTTTSSTSPQTGSKLIIFALSFPCGLNEGTTAMCAGAKAAAEHLPPGYELKIKTGVKYADNQAFNNLIQTSLQLDPSGLIVFPGGPAAQTPVMNQACDKGVKIIIMDSPATGVKCQSALVGADHRQLGAIVGKWLVEHPPSSKEVGIVTQPPGEYASTDNRVKGFKETVEAAGYKVVATAITDLSLDKTRTQVTNLLTAHPNLGAIFSANGPMGQGTAQALKGNHRIAQLTLDFDSTNIPTLLKGTVRAVGDQNPFDEGKLSVENMVKVLQGQKVPSKVNTELSVVDKTNVKERSVATASK